MALQKRHVLVHRFSSCIYTAELRFCPCRYRLQNDSVSLSPSRYSLQPHGVIHFHRKPVIPAKMRLLGTLSLQLYEYTGDTMSPYTTLSHRWGPDKDEVQCQEMAAAVRSTHTKAKPSYRKIKRTCQVALEEYGLNYVRVDTCYIDKSSTSELSEAINSMFRFYHEAEVCIAFLSDWSSEPGSFENSQWFTRGWTLQELAAPSKLHFYDQEWRYCGSKGESAFGIYSITKICTGILRINET